MDVTPGQAVLLSLQKGRWKTSWNVALPPSLLIPRRAGGSPASERSAAVTQAAGSVRTRIADWLRTLPEGHTFTMGDVLDVARVGQASKFKRRYREARQLLECEGWEFSVHGFTHKVDRRP